jgi:hypothetical protein
MGQRSRHVTKRSLHTALANLRGALLKLPATGPKGFEGLLASTLTEITGVPFRLAGSGSQFGLDGKASYASDTVCFEGKRYAGRIPRTEVLSKIAELSLRDDSDTDLWILGATAPVGTQLADDIRRLGEKSGIATLILDWTDHQIPSLAAALAMAETVAGGFIQSRLANRDLASKAVVALKVIRNDDGFADHAMRIKSLLLEPTTGVGIARQANIDWLTAVFSSRSDAKRFLRQPLAPADKTIGEPASRGALVGQIAPLLTGKPNARIAAILGDEGNGKSWLTAQSWLSLADKPLMVVFTADDFRETWSEDDLVQRLIERLIAQTGGPFSEAARNQWRRKLERWQKASTPDAPRLIVFIDGLNQRPRIDWARLIDVVGAELARIGGRLVVTARTAYYRSQIEHRLISSVLEVNVLEWTNAERDAILAARGIKGASLQPRVAASLRNPRVLGIALELLQSAQIVELEDLSVSRLLFEHILAQERDAPFPRPAREFTRRLGDHAREILGRVTARQRDDLKIFLGGLESVSDGRFFVPVEGDPTRYTLADDGLTLALGFAVLDELRAARRNGRDLAEALGALIEPIGALDLTAEVVLAAATVSCLDDECPTEIGATIIGAFAELQNPNADDFPAFATLAPKRPEAFMQAAQRLCLSNAREPNFDWIEAALQAAKADARAWALMIPILRSWLAYYTLAPEARMHSHRSHDPVDKVEEERTKRQVEIDEKLAVLSAPERELLVALTRNDDADLATLTRFGLTLIAGKPITPFAMALMHWSFANALNAGFGAPYKEFTHLVQLNRCDWPQAREAILRTARLFEATDVSLTGKWAVANLLLATGNPDDAARGEALVKELTARWPKFGSARAVEGYCASDPCDPASAKPTNISATAENYAAIDVSKIRLHMGNSDVDHLFESARPGIARFEPQIAISKHREFIADVLERSGFPLRQGMFEVRNHNALVSRDHAERIVARIRDGTVARAIETLSENERWIVAQYHLLVSFPVLSADEQIDALLLGSSGESIILDLMQEAKPLSAIKIEDLLSTAIRDDNQLAQYTLLAFARHSATPIPSNTRKQLPILAESTSEHVRAQALALIGAIHDEEALDAVVTSGWSAATVTKEDSFEVWYGSHLIIEAAVRGMIQQDEVLDRIAPELYGEAARRLNGDAAREVARRVDASIRRAAGLRLEIPVPDIKIRDTCGEEPARYQVSEWPESPKNLMESLQQLRESNEAFEERERRAGIAFEAFKAELTRAKAQIVLDRLRIGEFEAIAAADRPLAEKWFELFIELPPINRAAIHNIGLLLAQALAAWSSDKAVQLFAALSKGKPLARITYGRAEIGLDALSIWSAKDQPALEALRFGRLDQACNDAEIALEVLAALRSGKEATLRIYVQARLQSEQPAAIARALMVAGLSEHNQFNDAVLDRYKDTPGFIGRAHAAAIYAYQRNIWSAHWSRMMREAQQAEDYWRYAIQLEKVADDRLYIRRTTRDGNGEPHRLFSLGVESQLRNRLKKWRDTRGKKLFGDDAPDKIFLPVQA